MMPDRETLAATIHQARWPVDRQLAITPFEDEDRSGRDYCFRIADAVLDLLKPRPARWDDNTNRSYPPVEDMARSIYLGMPYDGPGERPA